MYLTTMLSIYDYTSLHTSCKIMKSFNILYTYTYTYTEIANSTYVYKVICLVDSLINTMYNVQCIMYMYVSAQILTIIMVSRSNLSDN